jgi:hypothetical protein
VNAERYNHMLETIFLPEMRRRNWNMARAWFQQDGVTANTARLSMKRRNCNMATAWFQQDGVTAHTARLSMNTLRAALPGRLLSRFGDIQWPSNSPELTAADFL